MDQVYSPISVQDKTENFINTGTTVKSNADMNNSIVENDYIQPSITKLIITTILIKSRNNSVHTTVTIITIFWRF